MTKKIGFIGAGNMANAIILGILSNGVVAPVDIYVYDICEEKCNILAQKGITICSSINDVVINSQYIVLAVKPQNYEEVLLGVKDNVDNTKVFVSIAAGISINYVQTKLDCDVPVVRVMPNTPLLLGKGATAVCRSQNINDSDFEFVKDMFALSGIVEELTEDYMNTVISVNGSSPAYIYLFAKAMADYAQENGIAFDKALNLICATLEGSATMLRESGDTPDTLIQKVCSKGGTTIEAINTLNEYSFYDGIKKAMANCTKRAEELGR